MYMNKISLVTFEAFLEWNIMNKSATIIQRTWRKCRDNPDYELCKKLHKIEYNPNSNLNSDVKCSDRSRRYWKE